MSWITSKGRVEGIARQVVKAEETYGTVDVATTVGSWNAKYSFVETPQELDRLIKAVEVELPVIRNERNIPHVSKVAYAVFTAAALTGVLDKDIEDPLTC